jgi:hypothetical protein
MEKKLIILNRIINSEDNQQHHLINSSNNSLIKLLIYKLNNQHLSKSAVQAPYFAEINYNLILNSNNKR